MLEVRRHRRGARHGSRHLPGVQRPRRDVREQGLFALSQPCPRCRGNGTVIEKPCSKCHGSGRERRLRNYTVKIKPGVKDGTKIRLKGKGEAGANGGPNGDLVVITRVAPSDTYERRGDDLLVQVPVTFATAALGGKVDVPTPEGAVSLKIPPAPRTASSCGSRAAARRSSRAPARATSSRASGSRCRSA